MKIHFEDISNLKIIDHINDLDDVANSIRLNIKISCGNVYRIIRDRVFFIREDKYYNVGIENFKKEDLIIILRYLENIKKCKEIYKERTPQGISSKKTFQIKEFLSKKKHIAIVDKTEKRMPIEYIGEKIKHNLSNLKNQYNRYSTILYDNKENKFVIITDKYDNTSFNINILHLMDDIKTKYKKECIVLSSSDYGSKYDKFIQNIIYF